MARRWSWWREPPWWAWVVTLGSVAFLLAGLPLAIHRGTVASDRGGGAGAPATRPDTTVAFLGDSYTSGDGANDPAHTRWTTLVAANFGWHEMNFGSAGTGYASPGPTGSDTYAARIAQIARLRPDMVVLSGGRNDLTVPADIERTAVADTFAGLRGAMPETVIVALEPMWDASERPAALKTIGDEVKSAALGVDAYYVPVPNPLTGHADLLTSDGVHPNEAGYAALAVAVESALKSADVPLASS